MKRKKNNHFSEDDAKFSFYIAPFLSSFAIFTLFGGANYNPTYNVYYTDWQARGVAGLVIAYSLIGAYDFLIKIPLRKNGKLKAKEGIKMFITSKFFYTWLFLIFYLIAIHLLWNVYTFIFSLILVIICFYFQVQFVKKYKQFIMK